MDCTPLYSCQTRISDSVTFDCVALLLLLLLLVVVVVW